MTGPHLFIDGRNCIYRAIYANQDGKYHSLIIMLRFMRTWLEAHKPHAIHVFWDAPRQTVWRKQILPGYKNRSVSRELPDRDIKSELISVYEAARDLFAVMNIRQYYRKHQEADDLIYAACRQVLPQEAIVVSSDGDFTQIPFFLSNVRVWEPRLSKWVDKPTSNPVIKKALMGDKSDMINGYAGIGPVKSGILTESPDKLQEFLLASGRQIFIRNLLLIDLALCPYLLANQLYIAKEMNKPLVYDKNRIMTLMGQHKLNGLFQEFDRVVIPFRNLVRADEKPVAV